MTKKNHPPKKISELKFDTDNANKGTARGRSLLEKSLQRCGFGRSVLLDKNNRIIAGNKTIETAGETGFENMRVIDTDGKEIIAVRRKDLDLLKDQKARELAILDNRVSELDIDWNFEVLEKIQNDGIDLSKNGFSNEEFIALSGSFDVKLPEKKKELTAFKKSHILISFDLDALREITDIIEKLKKIKGIEIETQTN